MGIIEQVALSPGKCVIRLQRLFFPNIDLLHAFERDFIGKRDLDFDMMDTMFNVLQYNLCIFYLPTIFTMGQSCLLLGVYIKRMIMGK